MGTSHCEAAGSVRRGVGFRSHGDLCYRSLCLTHKLRSAAPCDSGWLLASCLSTFSVVGGRGSVRQALCKAQSREISRLLRSWQCRRLGPLRSKPSPRLRGGWAGTDLYLSSRGQLLLMKKLTLRVDASRSSLKMSPVPAALHNDSSKVLQHACRTC